MFSDFINLLFPDCCAICDTVLSKHKSCICVACADDLPLNPTFFEEQNYTTSLMYGRLKMQYATSLLIFEKRGVVQKLLHQLKYKGQEDISNYLGVWTASQLLKTNWCHNLTMVVPVPIHSQRLKKRGYNQVEGFGKAIALALNIPYRDDILLKTKSTTSQVFKKRISRSGQLDDTLSICNENDLFNEDVLLVDDIITTGATLEACGSLLYSKNIKSLSVVSMAITI